VNTKKKTLITKSADNWVCDDNWSATLYEKSIDIKMNDLDLSHVNHCVIFDVEYL